MEYHSKTHASFGPTAGSVGTSRWSSLMTHARLHGIVVPIYVIIASVFIYPTLFHLTDAIGGIVDSQENYWNLWWIRQSLLRLGENPMRGSFMHYPFGLPLYFHTLNPLNGFLSIPLQACCGIAAAYNLMNLFWFSLAALSGYLLAWYVTRNRAGAFIAGLIYGFSPYMAFHLYVGQIPSLSMGFMPLYLLALLLGVRKRWTFLPLASFILLLIGLSDWHYLAFTVFMTGLVGVYESFRVRQPRAIVEIFGKLAAVGALFFVLFSPVLVPMIAEVRAEPYASRPLHHSVKHSADLLAFFLPSIFHPLWGDFASKIFERLV